MDGNSSSGFNKSKASPCLKRVKRWWIYWKTNLFAMQLTSPILNQHSRKWSNISIGFLYQRPRMVQSIIIARWCDLRILPRAQRPRRLSSRRRLHLQSCLPRLQWAQYERALQLVALESSIASLSKRSESVPPNSFVEQREKSRRNKLNALGKLHG